MRARILNASAGSGKTYQLAYKYVRDVVEQPGIYRHILAVTFTNKATEEMKSRILKEIHRLASGGASPYLGNLCRELSLDERSVRKRAAEVRSKILHDYSRFTVLTIDTFFQRILRAFIKELGIDLNYNVEIETASVLTKSADTLIEQITTDRDLQRWLTDFVQERIDEGKKWDIRDGILTLGGELFKEKNKDALSAARPREELARIVGEATAHAAATKKRMQDAAAEAVRIIGDAGASVADFPYKGSGFAAYFYAVAGGSFERYGSRAEAACTRDEAWGKPGSTAQGLRSRLQPLLREMCGLYDENVRAWNTCDLLRENYRSFALLSDLYAKVQQMCDQENMMLLSETKYILSEFIGHNDAPFIYEKVGNRFEHFMIDEFQDTSVKEWENFLPLLQNGRWARTAPNWSTSRKTTAACPPWWISTTRPSAAWSKPTTGRSTRRWTKPRRGATWTPAPPPGCATPCKRLTANMRRHPAAWAGCRAMFRWRPSPNGRPSWSASARCWTWVSVRATS